MPLRLFFLALLLLAAPIFAAVEPEIKTRVTTEWTDPTRQAPAPPQLDKPTKKAQTQARTAQPERPQRSTKTAPKKPQPTKLKPYWVQAGAFLQESNAHRLKAQLVDEGFKAQVHVTQDLDRQIYHLVLIGHFASKSKATDLAESYTKKRQEKSVVIHQGSIIRVFNPDPKLVTEQRIPRVYAEPGENQPDLLELPENIYRPVDNPQAKFTFQVGGLYNKGAANQLAAKLKKRGYKPLITKKKDVNGLDWWYAVEIGYFYTKAEAEIAASAFFEKENIQAEVPPAR